MRIPASLRMQGSSMLAELRGCRSVIQGRTGDRSTSYLPSAHIADRWASHYTSMALGHTITYVTDPKAVVAALPALNEILLQCATPASAATRSRRFFIVDTAMPSGSIRRASVLSSDWIFYLRA